MDNCYYDEATRSIVDLTDYYGLGLMMTRINVPRQHRGQGHGSALLKRVCEEADKDQVTLFLEVLPSGPLDYDQLVAWYERHGFKYHRGIYRRRPQGWKPASKT